MIRHLLFRCLHCRSTTTVQVAWIGRTPAEVACSNCNAVYTLPADRDRGLDDQDYHERARKFACESRIDLASAYSVLEGIMPREKVRTLASASPDIPRKTPASLRTLVYLTGLLVAAALLGHSMQTRWSPPAEPAVASVSRDEAPAPAPEPVPPLESVQPRSDPVPRIVPVVSKLDPDGNLTRIDGPDPRSVLWGFCQADPNFGILTPVSLSPTTPPSPGTWVGIMRIRDRPDEFDTVRIWLDPRTRRWAIGNGNGPIVTSRVREIPPDAEPITE